MYTRIYTICYCTKNFLYVFTTTVVYEWLNDDIMMMCTWTVISMLLIEVHLYLLFSFVLALTIVAISKFHIYNLYSHEIINYGI